MLFHSSQVRRLPRHSTGWASGSFTSLQRRSIFERCHNSLSRLRTGRAARGPCDCLCSHGGQTRPPQSLWIYAGIPCPRPHDRWEYPLCVGSWSSSMSEPWLCEIEGGGWKNPLKLAPQPAPEGHLKLPGPELLTGTLGTFHTHNPRLPRHTKSWQAELLGPLQDILPLGHVVDVVAINPQSTESFPWLWWLFLQSCCCSRCCCCALVHEDVEVFFEPLHCREHTHLSQAVFLEKSTETCMKLCLLGSAEAGTSMTQIKHVGEVLRMRNTLLISGGKSKIVKHKIITK